MLRIWARPVAPVTRPGLCFTERFTVTLTNLFETVSDDALLFQSVSRDPGGQRRAYVSMSSENSAATAGETVARVAASAAR